MKVKVLKTGEIIKAKRFKDMTEKEQEDTGVNNLCYGEEIFIEPVMDCGVWRYVYDTEVEIVEEDNQCSNYSKQKTGLKHTIKTALQKIKSLITCQNV